MTQPVIKEELDATGLSCPLPLLKAKLALNGLATGEVLKVLCTDVGSQRDFRSFAKLSGNDLIAESIEDDVFIYYLRKG